MIFPEFESMNEEQRRARWKCLMSDFVWACDKIAMLEKQVKNLAHTLEMEESKRQRFQAQERFQLINQDRKSTRLNSSHLDLSRMPSSA